MQLHWCDCKPVPDTSDPPGGRGLIVLANAAHPGAAAALAAADLAKDLPEVSAWAIVVRVAHPPDGAGTGTYHMSSNWVLYTADRTGLDFPKFALTEIDREDTFEAV